MFSYQGRFRLVWIFASVFVLTLCAPIFPEEIVTPNQIVSGNVDVMPVTDNILVISDYFDAHRDSKEQLESGIGFLKRKLKYSGFRYDLLWRLSKLYYELGLRTKEKAQAAMYFDVGIQAGTKALMIQPKGKEALLWTAFNMWQNIRPLSGFSPKKILGARKAKTTVEKLIWDNPASADGYYLLAEIYRESNRWVSVGDLKKARKSILRAIQINGNRVRNYLEYALICMDSNDWKPAKEALLKALELPTEPDRAIENIEERQLAQKNLDIVLEKLGEKKK